jgi:outer membrane autotransporter protein
MNRRKTKVSVVPHGWMRFLAGMAMLIFCLSLFCSNAGAMPDVNNVGAGPNRWGWKFNGDTTLSDGTDTLIRGEATSGDGAYGIIVIGGTLTILNNFSGIQPGSLIEGQVDAGDRGFGLATRDSIDTNNLGGTIRGKASGDRGYGIFADSSGASITTDAITGTISGTAGGDYAYGMYSWSTITTGAISGLISGTAGGDRAYGMFAHDDITTGAISGTIRGTAGGDRAYGMRSWDTITTGAITGTISAIAGGDYARGLYSNDGITTGLINGTITADANWNDAYGLYSWSAVTINGGIGSSANITATTRNYSGAYGLYAGSGGSDLTINGNIDGTITVDANQYNAYALYAYDDINIVGNIGSSANISARTRDFSNAYALYAGSDLTIHGNIDGTITADANQDYAYALYAYNDVNITGDIGHDAHITATAREGDRAFGLFSAWGNVTVGAIDGNIVATAGGSSARGLFSWGNLKTGAINGNITATAGEDRAAGLYAAGDYPGSTLTTGDVNGTITATAGGSTARGLASGGDIKTGAINGTITATAGEDDAAGLYSRWGSITTGPITGTITADANWDDAYGLYAYGDVNIVGGIGSSARISATARNGSYAYGIYAGSGGSDLIIHGDIDGTITATATDGSDAYALYAYDDINVVGDIGSTAHITATAGEDRAYGLFSEWGTVTTGDVNGTIIATAGGNRARGLFGWDSITTGAINGNITATAGGDEAAGLFSGDSLTVNGAINGNITATARGDKARGLFGGGDITTGDINGNITATAGEYYAAGLYSANGDITTGDITGTITATAMKDEAAGLFSANGSLTTGNIEGMITATARQDYAYGLNSYGDLTTGEINGTIKATAGENVAYGLRSHGDLTTDAINGTITAEALTGSEAYALYAEYSDPNINIGDIGSNALITARARYGYAYGLKSDYGSITTGAIYGTITAEVTDGDDAYALHSWSSLETGDIGSDAHITATSGEDYAAGLYSENGSLTTGNIAGTISATADGDRAYGLYSNGPLTTGNITGTISAHAGRDYAYGIMSPHGPMNVTIAGGTVRAVADDGTHAAAILSGNFDDSVNIAAGSTIVGDIDLASTTDNDTLTLSGINTRNTALNDDILKVENINITGGRWYINGNVYNNENGTVMSGGILGGTGTLGKLNVTGGTLAPGSSIGTMTVDGNLTLGSGSTFEAEVANDETADKVVVTGAAAVNGTIRGKAVDNLPIKHSFTVPVINAATGLTGTFTRDTSFLRYHVRYDRTNYDVLLDVEPTITDFSPYATTSNQRSVGCALNDFFDLHSDDVVIDDVLEAMYDLPDGAAVRAAYNQMMPQDALGQSEITRNAMNQYGESVFGRMDNVRNGRQYAMSEDSRYLLASAGNSAALPPKTNEWTPFAKGFGSWGDRDAESDIAGYQYNVYGMTGGIDKLVSDNTLVGLSVGGSWANVSYSQSGTSSDIDSMLCSLYGSYFVDDWHVGLTAGYGHSWYDSKRGIPFIGSQAKSDHQGNVYSAAVELGNNFGGQSMLLEPVVGLGYTLVQESGYTEKGAGALNLKVDSDTADGLYSKLGIRAAKEFRPEQNQDMKLVPNVSMFWIHDFADRVKLDSSFVGGGSFTTEGREPVRDTFNLGAGLNIYLKNNVRLFVDYGWQSASNFNSNTVQAGAQWSF